MARPKKEKVTEALDASVTKLSTTDKLVQIFEDRNRNKTIYPLSEEKILEASERYRQKLGKAAHLVSRFDDYTDDEFLSEYNYINDYINRHFHATDPTKIPLPFKYQEVGVVYEKAVPSNDNLPLPVNKKIISTRVRPSSRHTRRTVRLGQKSKTPLYPYPEGRGPLTGLEEQHRYEEMYKNSPNPPEEIKRVPQPPALTPEERKLNKEKTTRRRTAEKSKISQEISEKQRLLEDPIANADLLTKQEYMDATKNRVVPLHSEASKAAKQARISSQAAEELEGIKATVTPNNAPEELNFIEKQKFITIAQDFYKKNKKFVLGAGLAGGVLLLHSAIRANAEEKRSRPILDSDLDADRYLGNNGRRDGKYDPYAEYTPKSTSLSRIMTPFLGWGAGRQGRILSLMASNKQESIQHSSTYKPTTDINLPTDLSSDKKVSTGNVISDFLGAHFKVKSTHDDEPMSRREINEATARRMVHGRAF